MDLVVALRTLPAPSRELLVLSIGARLSYPDIARVTRLSEAAAREEIFRARQALQASLLTGRTSPRAQ